MILETERLYLRYLTLHDAMRMHEYRDKKEVKRYQTWTHYSLEDAIARILEIQDFIQFYRPRTTTHLGIVLKENDVLIGDLFVQVNNKKTFVLGYTLDSVYWSQGYGTEMVGAFIDYMRKIYHFKKVICYAYYDNERSIRLLKKLGFHRFYVSYFHDDVGYMKILDEEEKL